MKLYTATIILIVALFNAISFAEVSSDKQGENSIRKLINRLNNEYIFLNKALKELDESIRAFPETTLTLSVITRDKGIRLLSIDVLDDNRLLESHIYTPLESDALQAGGRHQLYKGEIKKGRHRLKVIYYWTEGNKPPQKSEELISLLISPGKNHIIELSVEKRADKIRLRHSQSEFTTR